jgi:hypothetical protein
VVMFIAWFKAWRARSGPTAREIHVAAFHLHAYRVLLVYPDLIAAFWKYSVMFLAVSADGFFGIP